MLTTTLKLIPAQACAPLSTLLVLFPPRTPSMPLIIETRPPRRVGPPGHHLTTSSLVSSVPRLYSTLPDSTSRYLALPFFFFPLLCLTLTCPASLYPLPFISPPRRSCLPDPTDCRGERALRYSTYRLSFHPHITCSLSLHFPRAAPHCTAAKRASPSPLFPWMMILFIDLVPPSICGNTIFFI